MLYVSATAGEMEAGIDLLTFDSMRAGDARDASAMAMREAVKEAAWRVLGMRVSPVDMVAWENGDTSPRICALTRIVASLE